MDKSNRMFTATDAVRLRWYLGSGAYQKNFECGLLLVLMHNQDNITTGSVVPNAAGSTPCAVKTGKPTFELLSNQRPNNGPMLSGMLIATSSVLLVDGAVCSGLTMCLNYGGAG